MNQTEQESDPKIEDETPDELLPLQEVAIRTAEIVFGLPELEITDRQQNQVSLLQKILDEEKTGRVVRRRKKTDRRTAYFTSWIRAGLAVFLFGAVIYALLRGGHLFPPPLPGANETTIQKLIANVQPGQVVFVAFDYDPGYAAEVEAAGAPLLQELGRKQAALVVLSTLPTGTVMAERYFQKAGAAARTNVFPAGYLPGNQAGLSSLVQSLRGTLKTDTSGRPLWDAPALRDVHQLDDLALVLLLVSDGQTARYWMEQVLPNLGETPLIVVASEQTAPLLVPYQQSAAFPVVSGRAGAGALEAALAKGGPPNKPWDAYQAAIRIALFALALGAVYALLPEDVRRAQKGTVEK